MSISDLKRTIDNYNKKVEINRQELKYETLMRLQLEDGSIMSPFKFLCHAKKARLYPILTKIVVEKSCEYFKNNLTN